jgi:hypothetical protein
MAQLDVFFSLFGIILVVLAIIKLSSRQFDQPPNFSTTRTVQPLTANTKVPLLGYAISTHQIWYVSQNRLYQLDRSAIANWLYEQTKTGPAEMHTLSEPDKSPRGTIFLDDEDPSGFFMQLTTKNLQTSAFFIPLTDPQDNAPLSVHTATEILKKSGRKPLAVFVDKKSAGTALLIESVALSMGISIKLRPSRLTLVRTPSMFYLKSRAR